MANKIKVDNAELKRRSQKEKKGLVEMPPNEDIF